jgi:hypothetical protein
LEKRWNNALTHVAEMEQRVDEAVTPALITADLCRDSPGCCRIRKIPGIGPIVATAIVAAIGNGAAFRKGRDFAAWLGLTIMISHQVCIGTARTKEQSKRRICNLITIMVFNDRPTCKDRHAAELILARSTRLHQRPNTLPQTCLSTKLNLAVARRTIHYRY